MAKNETQAWQAIEEQAFHAYREWHLWLALRQKELASHLRNSDTPRDSTVPKKVSQSKS